MKGFEVRRKFLDYFIEKGHVEVPSSSLVPENDPTLLIYKCRHESVQKCF